MKVQSDLLRHNLNEYTKEVSKISQGTREDIFKYIREKVNVEINKPLCNFIKKIINEKIMLEGELFFLFKVKREVASKQYMPSRENNKNSTPKSKVL